MPVYMTHEKHGATHVNTGQVEAHEANGWKVAEYPTFGKTPVIEEEVIEPAEVVEVVEKAKPGRKPKAK